MNEKKIGNEYIPFGKPNFSEHEIESVVKVLKSGWIGMGKEVIKFEQELGIFLNSQSVVTVDSCTSALFLSLLVSNIKQGDEVICPSLTWCSTANVALFLGAKVVFADIDKTSLNININSIKEKITKKTKAIIVVHYGGLSIDVKKLREVIPNNISIIEDAAHALGANYPDGSLVGSSENLTCFSFYANKNLSTAEGGAIAVTNTEQADRLKSLRQHGMPINAWKRFSNPKNKLYSQVTQLGYKMNYTDLHATIGRVQLKRQENFAIIRHNIAKKYYEDLKDLKPEIKFQTNITNKTHALHLFVIQLPIDKLKITRDEFLQKLRDKNIGASLHYMPLHLMSFYKKNISLPNTEHVFERILTLPISASINDSETNYIIKEFKEIFLSNLK